jgi:hypothetical protein
MVILSLSQFLEALHLSCKETTLSFTVSAIKKGLFWRDHGEMMHSLYFSALCWSKCLYIDFDTKT